MNGVGKCIKIRHVMKLRPIARKLRNVASVLRAAQALAGKLLSPRSCRVSYVSEDKHVHVVGVKKSNDGFRRSWSLIPADVPSGHLAVYVGQQCNRRFVIRVAYLNHPVFRELLEQAEEQFGYTHQGVLAIPCDELLFENILRLFIQNDVATVMHLDLETVKSNFCKESTPLHAIAEKSIGW